MIAVNEYFSVVDEGEGWILLNKGAPLIVHPANDRGDEATLLGGVQSLLAYELANGAALSIMNRLDRETSGLVMMATRKSVARELGRAMERRLVSKSYDAVVFGWPEWDTLRVDEPMLRKGEVEESRIYVKQMVHPEGKQCVTNLEVLRRYVVKGVKVAHLRVKPTTGRMHQIRVHAAFVGHPLVGDKIYGEDEDVYLRFIVEGEYEGMLDAVKLPRHALHASGLKLELAGEWQEFEIGLADDIAAFLAGAEAG